MAREKHQASQKENKQLARNYLHSRDSSSLLTQWIQFVTASLTHWPFMVDPPWILNRQHVLSERAVVSECHLSSALTVWWHFILYKITKISQDPSGVYSPLPLMLAFYCHLCLSFLPDSFHLNDVNILWEGGLKFFFRKTFRQYLVTFF